MTNYYDLPKDERKKAGVDYDLAACLEYNPQGEFVVEDIARVLAVYEGEKDEEDWRWILKLKDGRYLFLEGGCDYTGWDCRSWASHAFADSPESCVEKALPVQKVYASLMQQLQTNKHETWREKQDKTEGL